MCRGPLAMIAPLLMIYLRVCLFKEALCQLQRATTCDGQQIKVPDSVVLLYVATSFPKGFRDFRFYVRLFGVVIKEVLVPSTGFKQYQITGLRVGSHVLSRFSPWLFFDGIEVDPKLPDEERHQHGGCDEPHRSGLQRLRGSSRKRPGESIARNLYPLRGQ